MQHTTNWRTRIIAMIVGMFALAASIVAIQPAPPAHASTFWVAINQKSDGSMNIYNKAGCLGATNHIYAGQSSSTDHIWKTFWAPKHSRVYILHYSTGYSYHIDNPHGWRTCHNIGKYFDPVGISMYWKRNS